MIQITSGQITIELKSFFCFDKDTHLYYKSMVANWKMCLQCNLISELRLGLSIIRNSNIEQKHKFCPDFFNLSLIIWMFLLFLKICLFFLTKEHSNINTEEATFWFPDQRKYCYSTITVFNNWCYSKQTTVSTEVKNPASAWRLFRLRATFFRLQSDLRATTLLKFLLGPWSRGAAGGLRCLDLLHRLPSRSPVDW